MNLCTKCGFEVGGVLCKCSLEDRIDWDLIFGEGLVVLVSGEDFTCSAESIIKRIENEAKDRALEVKTGRCRNPVTKKETNDVAVRVVDGIC